MRASPGKGQRELRKMGRTVIQEGQHPGVLVAGLPQRTQRGSLEVRGGGSSFGGISPFRIEFRPLGGPKSL